MQLECRPRQTPVIDAHVHVFDPEICQERHRVLPRDHWFEHLYADPRAALVPVEDLVASMDAAGIDRAVVCGFPWADPDLCRAHNDYLAACARAYPERVSWLATVVPHAPSAAAEAERCFALGAAGVGELNADAQGFDFLAPSEMSDLVVTCVARQRPILFHLSEPVGHHYPGKGTATPEKFVHFLAACPDLRVVAAHWGGGLPFYELMPEVAALARNVVYDSAASSYLYRFDVFRTVVDLVGPERVLMASDYPVLRQRRFLRRVRETGLTPEELGPVLGGNAARVYRLAEGGAVDD
ncbi:MAG TPA: amidohydrolase family protein [Thermomicrobiaceae bacterium]|nr:amidohydrolase family protein [Thermomicrobiaceae bacterium]